MHSLLIRTLTLHLPPRWGATIQVSWPVRLWADREPNRSGAVNDVFGPAVDHALLGQDADARATVEQVGRRVAGRPLTPQVLAEVGQALDLEPQTIRWAVRMYLRGPAPRTEPRRDILPISTARRRVPPPPTELSPREREVYALMLQGQSCKAMARELGVGPSTIKTHQLGIYRKCGVETNIELLARRIRELEEALG